MSPGAPVYRIGMNIFSMIPTKVTGFDDKQVKVSLAGGEFWIPRATIIEKEFKTESQIHLRYDEHTQAALKNLAASAAAQQAKNRCFVKS